MERKRLTLSVSYYYMCRVYYTADRSISGRLRFNQRHGNGLRREKTNGRARIHMHPSFASLFVSENSGGVSALKKIREMYKIITKNFFSFFLQQPEILAQIFDRHRSRQHVRDQVLPEDRRPAQKDR